MGQFRRSLTGAPTCHLAMGNCGPAEENLGALETLFAPYGGTVTPGRGHMAFVSLPTPEAAAAAHAALQGTAHASLPGSGPLSLKYAELEDDSGAAPSEPPLVAVRSAGECGIPGLSCHPDFVSAEEAAELLREADAQQHWQCLARRRVLHFGAAFDYEARDVGAPQQPIPPAARRIADRIQQLPGAVAIDQLTVNEYGPGVGIAPHVETHAAFTGAIVSLCLGGPAVMVFRRDGHSPRALFLPPRSLLVMADEARYAWQHYIPHRKSDLVASAGGAGEPEVVPRAERRVSFTFRQVRAFLEGLPRGALVADVGCGNGKYFGVRTDGFVLGSDRSAGLAGVASRRLQPPPLGEGLCADVAVADGLALPYRPGTCDGVLCIAVLHHIASPARRLALLAQLLRVLRPGGRALVTVWATEQENMRKVRSWQPITAASPAGGGSGDGDVAGEAAGRDGSEAVASGDYFVPWHLPFHRAEAAAAARAAGGGAAAAALGQGSKQDSASAAAAAGAAGAAAPAAATPRLDSSKGAVVFQRYYHLFERGELEGLVAQLPGAALVDSFYDKDNWCAVFERVA
ncbi:alkylated DNA repair alkB-like protein 8 [Chlorella sorokiniana]|uniref:Alkylated DNA repair alkB-like protein 8 n=1 Tax=Chlorella sorokiniana TaxID=3076 RepID=A0A2P6TTH7_CHLSO|nr:alkylated DNA repair alkB-like protein 8 [Chlorella sorokiniana]|eukprot:PRW57369.1 alkylated DNA repair alkB-like protein 8 [Chlorella sorokiniana]